MPDQTHNQRQSSEQATSGRISRQPIARDFTQYLKVEGTSASISFLNSEGRTHKYTFAFNGKGGVALSVHDVTPDWAPEIFDYKQSREVTLGKGTDVSTILKPLLDAFCGKDFLATNSKRVTREEAAIVLEAAFLRAGITSNRIHLRGQAFYPLNPAVALREPGDQAIVISNAQREHIQRGVNNCLGSVFAGLSAMWTINPRNIKEFQKDEARDIFHALRGDLVKGSHSVEYNTRSITHDGKTIGTFHQWESRIGNVDDKIIEMIKNAPVGSMVFMRQCVEDPAERARLRIRNNTLVTHVGYVSAKGMVCHNIGGGQIKNEIGQYDYYDNRSPGISKRWEICGIFIPEKSIIAVPQDMTHLAKCMTYATMLKGKSGNLSLDVRLEEVASYLVQHAKYFRGQSVEKVIKTIFDLNATLLDPAQEIKSTAWGEIRIRPGMPLRLMNQWLIGTTLEHRSINSDGSKSGTLSLSRRNNRER